MMSGLATAAIAFLAGALALLWRSGAAARAAADVESARAAGADLDRWRETGALSLVSGALLGALALAGAQVVAVGFSGPSMIVASILLVLVMYGRRASAGAEARLAAALRAEDADAELRDAVGALSGLHLYMFWGAAAALGFQLASLAWPA